MVDIAGLVKWGVIGIAVYMVLSIAAQPGITGKIFAGIIIGFAYYIYSNMQKQNKAPDAVNLYFSRLKRDCKLKGSGKLKKLILEGDGANQSSSKGNILGGPVFSIRKDLTEKDPKRVLWIFLYTPNTSFIYTMPPFSWIMGNFKVERLFGVFHNPNADNSQLRTKFQMNSKDPFDKYPKMVGDLRVKGISTISLDQIDYVNDHFYNIAEEYKVLGEHVEYLTLEDDLRRLPERIRNAVDSNSSHVKQLDLKDIVGGFAKPEQSSMIRE